MSGGEQLGQPEQPEHEGEHYLRLLGLEHLADRKITTADKILEVRDFLDICGEHARPLLAGFEAMDPTDPDYEITKAALKGLIGNYVEGDNPS